MDNQQEWARILDALSNRREQPDESTRHRVAQDALSLAGTVTDQVVGCSVTEATASGFRTPIASNALALELDMAQYAASAGPCIAACRDGRPHSITTMTGEEHYPHFTGVAEQHGVRSSLSLPLAGARPASALNLYARSLSAFEDPRVRAVAELLARCVARSLPDSPAPAGPGGSPPEAVQRRRRLVQQAQAVLAADGRTTKEAFDVMRRRSIAEQRSIFDIARDVVERSAR